MGRQLHGEVKGVVEWNKDPVGWTVNAVFRVDIVLPIAIVTRRCTLVLPSSCKVKLSVVKLPGNENTYVLQKYYILWCVASND